ncbi:ABC transporter permease [Candidatus Pyrohabitans sp.]
MRVLSIAKRELWEIVSNRKFMLAFGVQTLLLLALLPAFGNLFAEGNLALPAPSMREFIPLGVVVDSDDCDVLLASLERNERLKLYRFANAPEEELKRGMIAAYLLIPRDYRESELSQQRVQLFLSTGIKSSSALDAVKESITEAGAELSRERQKRLKANLTNLISIKREFLKPVVVQRGGEQFSSFFLAYLVPLVLFFPLFMSGGLVVDAIVGEKDRKTIEALIAAPFHRYEIIAGKFTAVWGFVTAECAVWVAGIAAVGIPIAKPLEAFLLLAALNALVIAIATALALYSRNLKEANIALMIFYVPLFVALIYALTIEFFSPREFFSYVPFNLLSRAVSGEGFSSSAFALLLFGLGTVALGIVGVAAALSYRDDIIFGPRPGVRKLLDDSIETVLSGKSPLRAGIATALLLSPGVFLAASAVELASALSLLWLLGYSLPALYLLVLLSAAVEEGLKLLPVYLILRRRREWVNTRSIVLVAAASGAGFFLVETALAGVSAAMLLGIPLTPLLYQRFATTLIMHLAASSIAGAGLYVKGRRGVALFALAVAAHALFNFAVMEVAL